MKKIVILATAILLSTLTMPANAQGLLTNLLEGVFQKSDLTLADLAGEWTVDGSAVAFQSDNFLKKAGGIAASSAIEEKINPYIKQYGLDGASVTVDKDGSFEIKTNNKMTLSGTIVQDKDKNFTLQFKALGITLAKINARVQKTSKTLDILFDAKGLKKLFGVLTKISGSKLAESALDVLDSYDGLYVGLHTQKTGSVEGEEQQQGLGTLIDGIFGGSSKSQPEQQPSKQQNTQQETRNQGSAIGSILQGLFGGDNTENTQKNESADKQNTNKADTTNNSTNSGLGKLIEILGNRKK